MNHAAYYQKENQFKGGKNWGLDLILKLGQHTSKKKPFL